MNVQYSAYPAPRDFQDPGSHSIFPTRASDKPFFVPGLLHRLQEGVGGSCPPSCPLQAQVLGPCCSSTRLSNPDSFAHHHHHHLQQEGGSRGDKEGGVELKERQNGKPILCVGGQPGPSLPTPVGNVDIPDICFHAKVGQNISILQFC